MPKQINKQNYFSFCHAVHVVWHVTQSLVSVDIGLSPWPAAANPAEQGVQAADPAQTAPKCIKNMIYKSESCSGSEFIK
jgi:hypothetical protein